MPQEPSRAHHLRRVQVRVPATTANLGPGFDCMGMALDIYDRVALSPVAGAPGAPVGENAEDQYADLVRLAAQRLYQEMGQPAPALAVTCARSIPIGRGLGGSAAAIVAGLLGANRLAGDPLGLETIGQLAAALEGHPDNSTPCLYGGFQLCVMEEGRLVHVPVPLPEDLKAVLFIPDFPLPTHETRKLLPKALSRADVVYQTSRAALLVAALATGRLEHLRVATQDRLHQPARGAVFPGMWGLIDAALEAGALCAYLSGGGPTVLALARSGEGEVLEALERAARSRGISGQGRIARPTATGAHVVAVA